MKRKLWSCLQRYKPFLYIVGIEGLAVLLVYAQAYLPIPLGCPFKAITGIPCPGCGGIRAAQFILSGKFLDALYTNPLSCILIVFLSILPIWQWVDCYRQTHTLHQFLHSPWHKSVYFILGILVLLNWLWNIQKQL